MSALLSSSASYLRDKLVYLFLERDRHHACHLQLLVIYGQLNREFEFGNIRRAQTAASSKLVLIFKQ